MVSKGNRSPSSIKEAKKVQMLHVDGFTTGSSVKYDLRNRGMLLVSKLGRVEDKMVIGRR